MSVCAEAATGHHAIELFRAHRPDVTLMDLQLPTMSGLEAIRAIRRHDENARIDGQVAEISPEKAVLNGYATTNIWLANIAQMKTWLKTRADWIDGNYVRPPSFNQNGGDVPDALLLDPSGPDEQRTRGPLRVRFADWPWGPFSPAEDYLPLHQWFDESKAITADFRHRALRHHAEGIFMLERFFGKQVMFLIPDDVPKGLLGQLHAVLYQSSRACLVGAVCKS
jgi:CheY-like chemotaxis protein